MIEQKYIIHPSQSLLEALIHINDLQQGPMVLFVVDDDERMVGTITDGDVRRALIAGATVNEKTCAIMQTNFNYIREGDGDIVLQLHKQRELNMSLVPILDCDNRISDIINLMEFKTKLPIDVVLMAGGKGERLRPLTEKIPKPMLKVGSKAIIDHTIDRLISYGVKNINVTVNYLKEQLEEHFEKPRNGVKVQTVREPKFLGTIGSIKYVNHFYNDTILVMNSDVFTNLNFEDFYLHFKKHDADMSVCAIPYSVQVPYGIFRIEGIREIKGLVEKPTFDYYANAGIYLLKKSALEYIPNDIPFHSTDLIERLVKSNKKVVRFPLNGTWIDIGTPIEYKRANDIVSYMHF